MTTMDKMGIGIAIAVVAVALGITSFSEPGVSEISPVIEQTTSSIKEAGQEIQASGSETLEKVKETTQQVAEETREFTETTKEIAETTKELATSKSPSRLVSIPAGTAVPGCEEVGLCYDPPSLIIFKGAEVIWRNDDTSAHTVTSGNIIEGPDGIFDSGLIKADETFSFRFEETGQYDYFCMIHPWAKASVTVS